MEQQPDHNQQNAYEEEISLYDIIQKLLVHKWFIIAFTAAALILSVVYVGFVQESSYEAQGAITISQQQSSWSDMTTDTVIQQILTEPIMREVIDSLNLEMSPTRLASQIDVNSPDRRIIVTVSHNSSDQELSRDVVNTLLHAYQRYVTDLLTRDVSKRMAFLETSLSEESQSFKELQQPYYEALHTLDLLKQEYTTQADILFELTKVLNQDERESNSITRQFDLLRRQLDEVPETLRITREISLNNPSELMNQSIPDSSSIYQDQVITEEIPNDLYLELKSTFRNLERELVARESNVGYISEQIVDMNDNVIDTLRQIKHMEAEVEKVGTELDLSRRNRSSFQDLLGEATIEKASIDLQPPIIISYLASLPTEDTSNKRLVIAVAVLLGLFLSVLIIFVKDAYLEEKNRKSSGTGEI